MPVLFGRGLAVDEDHHGGHVLGPLGVGYIVALDAAGHGVHADGFRQLFHRAHGAFVLDLLFRVALFQRVPGVLFGQQGQGPLVAALGDGEGASPAPALAQPFLQIAADFSRQVRAQHFPGRLAVALVKLHDEIEQHFALFFLALPGQGEGIAA